MSLANHKLPYSSITGHPLRVAHAFFSLCIPLLIKVKFFFPLFFLHRNIFFPFLLVSWGCFRFSKIHVERKSESKSRHHNEIERERKKEGSFYLIPPLPFLTFRCLAFFFFPFLFSPVFYFRFPLFLFPVSSFFFFFWLSFLQTKILVWFSHLTLLCEQTNYIHGV